MLTPPVRPTVHDREKCKNRTDGFPWQRMHAEPPKNLQRKGLLTWSRTRVPGMRDSGGNRDFQHAGCIFLGKWNGSGTAAARSCSRNNLLTVCFFITIGNNFASHPACNLRVRKFPSHPFLLLSSSVDFAKTEKSWVLNSATDSLRCFMSQS
jgi:hypothetical protein